MVTASKKLPCNHIFHTACLRSWFQRQQTCPTCRLNILRPTVNQARARPENQPQAAPAPQNIPAQGANIQRNCLILINIYYLFSIFTNNNNVSGPPFHLPGFWPQFPPPPPPPPPTTFASTSGTQPQGQGRSSTAPQLPHIQLLTAGGIPFFAPPFSSIVPLPPVPTPPPNLSTLSEEELHAMEGNTRQAVEARIETLRRVQLLMDAAIAMMGQYQSAAPPAK